MARIPSTSNTAGIHPPKASNHTAFSSLGARDPFCFSSTQSIKSSRALHSAAGSDIFLATPPSSNQSLIQYRLIGGTLDLYFFSGPEPKSVIEQYGQVVGLPARPPNWGFGFHLCRWGYASLSETKQQVDAMRAANIPLEGAVSESAFIHGCYTDRATAQ
jgi:alpha-glucosidase (family GH31 glycosyl hydrolase)